MSAADSIVLKLQADAIDRNASVAGLLRTAKLVATKLDLKDALIWIDRELDGYLDLPTSDLPAYRQLSGELRALNPYRGWQPIIFQNAKQAKAFSQAPIGSPIGSIEEDVGGREGRTGILIFTMSADTKARLVKALEFPTDVQLQLSYGSIYGILDAVRNLILNWTLELEKRGILGEGMQFSSKDKEVAAPATQQIFAQNIGVLGSIGGLAQVTNQQTASLTIDLVQLKDFLSQAEQALPLLPAETRAKLEPSVNDMKAELQKKKPDQSRLRELMQSARGICEGAAGNLAAEGIIGLIKNFVGGG